LRNAEGAASEIQDGVMGREWRIRWASVVVLLRVVGHVLKKVDAARDPLLEQVINEKWQQLNTSKPEPLIFLELHLTGGDQRAAPVATTAPLGFDGSSGPVGLALSSTPAVAWTASETDLPG